MRVGSATCGVVGCPFKFVKAANMVLPLLSGGGGNSGISMFSVFVSALPVSFCFWHFLQRRGRPRLPWA